MAQDNNSNQAASDAHPHDTGVEEESAANIVESELLRLLKVTRHPNAPFDNYVCRIMMSQMDEESLIRFLGLEEAHAQVFSGPMFGEGEHEIYPDTIVLAANDESEIEAAKRNPARDRNTLTVFNAEFTKEVHRQRHPPQLRKYHEGSKRRFGRNINFCQSLFTSSCTCPPAFLHFGDRVNGVQFRSPCVRLANLSCELLSDAFRKTAIGAASAMLFREGASPEAVAILYEHLRTEVDKQRRTAIMAFVTGVAHMVPELPLMVRERAMREKEGLNMPNAITSSSPWETSLMQEFARQFGADLPMLRQTVPEVAAEFARAKEQGRAEARAEARTEARFESLLAVLKSGGIQLGSEQEEELRAMTLEQLPEIQVAISATSAEHFAKLAGLSNS